MNKAPGTSYRPSGSSSKPSRTPSVASSTIHPPYRGVSPPRRVYEEDSEPDDSIPEIHERSGNERIVIAIDYGTTYSGVGWAVSENDEATLNEVRILKNWGHRMTNDTKIPSVISYSPCTAADELQFGSSLSPNAVAMVNTKLELDAQDTRQDELDLIIQVLDGMKDLHFDHIKKSKGLPEYSWKDPEEIATDYIQKMYQSFEKSTDFFVLQQLKNSHPVDIVMTVPVNWSYRAKNATFRAIRNAGFNEENFPHINSFVLMTESEAAALYTAQYYKEKEAEKVRVGECFVLCDAGGGTVDVAAYKVKQVEPTLELELWTIPTGVKCGSSFINTRFKKWLRKILGEKNYCKLDPRGTKQKDSGHAMEGGQMRDIMQSFERHKKAFTRDSTDMRIDLPKPLDNLTIPGRPVDSGEVTITSDDMCELFDPSVDTVIEEIQSQIRQVEQKRNRAIFLTGGFSESPYLQEELDESLRLRKIKFRRPETSWSAVIRGAVLHGMELSNRKSAATMLSCPTNYGFICDSKYYSGKQHVEDVYRDILTNEVRASQQLTWVVKKGDLIMAGEIGESEHMLTAVFGDTDQRVVILPFVQYEESDVPDRYQTAHEELKEVFSVRIDFSQVSRQQFDECQNVQTGQIYYRINYTLKIRLENKAIVCEAWWYHIRLGGCSEPIFQ